MKIERKEKKFEPITIILETELECGVIASIFAANPADINRACLFTSAEAISECFSKHTDTTAYDA